jgi:hypothetical protein
MGIPNELIRLLSAIPIIPFASESNNWLRNRRKGSKGFASVLDVINNVSDSYYGFTRRIPNGAGMVRDRDNRFNSSFYQLNDRQQQFPMLKQNGDDAYQNQSNRTQGNNRRKKNQKSNFKTKAPQRNNRY